MSGRSLPSEAARAVAESWPVVGRSDELAQIQRAAARGGGVLLVGVAGVGRSALAREAARALATGGHPVAWAFATRDAAGIPFGALLHLLRPTGPGLGAGLGAGSGYLAPSHVLDAALRISHQLATGNGRRRVLVVDDAHLLDGASAAVVANLATRGGALVVATVRAGVPAPDSITRLWRDGVLRRVEVLPLAGPAVDALLCRVLAGPSDAVSRRELRRLTAGRPQLLRELVHAGLESGCLRQVDGIWHWSPGSYVTDRLVDLLHARTAGLGPESVRVLEVIACAGQVPLEFLAATAGEAATGEAERCGLVVAARSGARLAYRLAYPMDGQVVRARLPRARAQAIYRQLAAALARTPMRRADDVLQLVVWLRNAHLPVPARQLLAAARRATARLELELAERLCAAARRAGGGWEADLALAGVLVQQGRYAEAEAVLPAAPALPDPAAEPVRARIRELLGQPPLAGQGAIAGPDTATARAWSGLRGGRTGQSLLHGARIVHGDPATPVAVMVAAAAVAITAAGLAGDFRQVRKLAEAVRPVAGGQSPWREALVEGTRCLATALADSPGHAALLAERGYRRALRAWPAPVVGVWSAVRGMVARQQGRVATAQSCLREAAVLLRESDPLRLAHVCLAELAGAHALAGDRDRAARWLARAEDHEPSPQPLTAALVERARAWVRAAGGDPAGGAELAIRAADLARAAGQPTVEVSLLFDAARLGHPRAVGPRLDRLAAEHRGVPAAGEFAGTVAAVSAGDPVRLDERAVRLERLGYLLPAAEAATTAYRLYAAAGHRLRANAALVRAHRLREACEGARTPLLDIAGVNTVLTRRELQVAQLAAEGLSDRAVAARLGLALRTVNNHLTRVYAKLGVAGRAELPAVLSSAAAAPAD